MILTNKAVEISGKGLIRGVLERNRHEDDEAIEHFVDQAPKEVNAIIGVQVSSSTQQFLDVTNMYLTMVGTPIIFEKK